MISLGQITGRLLRAKRKTGNVRVILSEVIQLSKEEDIAKALPYGYIHSAGQSASKGAWMLLCSVQSHAPRMSWQIVHCVFRSVLCSARH